MRFSLLHLCFLLLLLVFGTESRALGVSDGQKPHQGIYFRADLTGAGEEPSEVQDRIRETVAWEYDSAPDVRDGPNLYCYVLQNPWSAFDPEGLWLEDSTYNAPLPSGIMLTFSAHHYGMMHARGYKVSPKVLKTVNVKNDLVKKAAIANSIAPGGGFAKELG